MKKLLATLGLVAIVALTCAPAAGAQEIPNVTITVTGLPKNKPLVLAVGESATFEIQISSDQPFVNAAAMPDSYYPGRGVLWNGPDQTAQGTEATLYLTVTAKDSTFDLAAVCGWPAPGDCWDAGEAPLAIVAGARFAGGLSAGEVFPFSVIVTE
jgi:hypothetical protein